jgi:hypothetical protein
LCMYTNNKVIIPVPLIESSQLNAKEWRLYPVLRQTDGHRRKSEYFFRMLVFLHLLSTSWMVVFIYAQIQLYILGNC